MGSGRGDRNQDAVAVYVAERRAALQWGPVVVTGISGALILVVFTKFLFASMGSGRGDRNQGSRLTPSLTCDDTRPRERCLTSTLTDAMTDPADGSRTTSDLGASAPA